MRILFLLSGDVTLEQKVNKELFSIKQSGNKVTVIHVPNSNSFRESGAPSHEQINIQLLSSKLSKNILCYFFRYVELTVKYIYYGMSSKPDIIHCIDILPLFATFVLSRLLCIKYIYEAQEIHSEKGSLKPKWMWYKLEKTFALYASKVVVSDTYRKEIIEKILSLPKSKTMVLGNFPCMRQQKVSGRKMLEEIGADSEKIIVLYFGLISEGRHLETSVQALMRLPERYQLVFLGFGEQSYIQKLKSLAKDQGIIDRFFILAPVPCDEICDFIRLAHCALVFYENISLNNYYASPSKLFDALLARLPIIATANPLAVEVLNITKSGIYMTDVNRDSMALSILQVTSPEWKRDKRFQDNDYIWEKQEDAFLSLYPALPELM